MAKCYKYTFVSACMSLFSNQKISRLIPHKIKDTEMKSGKLGESESAMKQVKKQTFFCLKCIHFIQTCIIKWGILAGLKAKLYQKKGWQQLHGYLYGHYCKHTQLFCKEVSSTTNAGSDHAKQKLIFYSAYVSFAGFCLKNDNASTNASSL